MMTFASELTVGQIAAALEETHGVLAPAARLLGVDPSSMRQRLDSDRDVRRLVNEWKKDERYVAARREVCRQAALKRHANARAERAAEWTGKTPRGEKDPKRGPMPQSNEFANAPLMWWETRIINQEGLKAMLKGLLLLAADDLKRTGKVQESAQAFFDSEWYRVVMGLLDRPATLTPKGYSRGRSAGD